MTLTADHPARSSPLTHGAFIPSIEGMRSLAVLAVLFFHLDISVFAGGFLGVDLFFVISGFIITRNILSDLNAGKFSLRTFYVRRFFRLFPALLVTILLSLLIAVTILPPTELAQTARSSIYALFSMANFNFWWQSGYFDAAAHTKPLLHTWSLSVEEQFYLLWPATLLFFTSHRIRLGLTCGILFLSLGSALIFRNNIPDGIFYLLPFRAHQLMSGALVAILTLRLTGRAGGICTVIATLGFLGVIVPMAGQQSPAVGAAWVSLFGILLLLGRESHAAKFLYGNRAMQWVGKRSYVLYLVHWPAIVLFKYFTDFELDQFERFLLFFISFLAAIGLHEFIEKPFRTSSGYSTTIQKIATPATVVTLMITLVIAASFWIFDGLPSRIDPRLRNIVKSVGLEQKLRMQNIRSGTCDLHKNNKISDYNSAECAKVDPVFKNVLIIGDSFAADAYMMLSQSYDQIRFSQATATACPAFISVRHHPYPSCNDLNELIFSELIDRDMDLLLLVSNWQARRNSISRLRETVDYLHSRGKKVLVIGPRAHFIESVPSFVARQVSVDAVNSNASHQIRKEREYLMSLRAAIPDVEIFDMASIQCAPTCDVLEDDRLLYVDEVHFTLLGAKRFGERFKQSFDLPGYINGLQPPSY